MAAATAAAATTAAAIAAAAAPLCGAALLHRSVERALEDACLSGVLNLSGRKLKDFPGSTATFDLSDVTEADLSRNRLSEVPLDICRYVSMETLYLYHNCIKSIPDPLGNLQVLTYLNLSRNQLGSLPAHVCKLPVLKVLVLSNNKIGCLPPEIGQLCSLLELDVSCNELEVLPPEMGSLVLLRELNVRRNRLTCLPDELSQLPLVSLDFACNRVTEIPLCYRRLRGLQVIQLDNNPLRVPPAQVCVKGKVHIMKFLTVEACRIEGRYEPFETPEQLKRPIPKRVVHGFVEESVRERSWRPDSGIVSDSGDKRFETEEEPCAESPKKPAAPDPALAPSPSPTPTPPPPPPSAETKRPLLVNGSAAGARAHAKDNHVASPREVATTSPIKDPSPPGLLVYITGRTEVTSGSPDQPAAETHRVGGAVRWDAAAGGDHGGGDVHRKLGKMDSIPEGDHGLHGGDGATPSSPAATAAGHGSQLNATPAQNGPTEADASSSSPPAQERAAADDGDWHPFGLKPRSAFTLQKSRLHPLLPANPNFTVRRKMEQMKEEIKLIEQLRENIESRLNVCLPLDMGSALMDGVTLCNLANRLRPRSVLTIYETSPAVQQLSMNKCRKNVESFLAACKKMGVPKERLCLPHDILEEKGLAKVGLTVQALLEMSHAR